MQKHLLLISFVLCCTIHLRAGDPSVGTLSGTYQVGASQAYKKLTDIASALNNPGISVVGDVVFELNSDYDGTTGETFPITFNQYKTTGGNWTVTIRPKTGVTLRTTSGDPGAQPLITLNGTDRLILDGRAGGSGGIGWLIRNTNTNAASAIYVANDAQYNVFTYLQVEGQPRSTNAIILVGGTTQTEGNDNNTISYCTIRDRSDVTATYANAIYFSQSTSPASLTKYNSGNVITHNDILNFYASGGIGSGVRLDAGTTETQVTNNNFYHTRAMTGAAAGSGLYVIYVNGTTASNTLIRDNFIGGSAPGCGGTAFPITGVSMQYCGIMVGSFDVPLNAGNLVDHNTIRNLDITSENTIPGAASPFTGIMVRLSQADITNNTIGTTNSNDGIKITINNVSSGIEYFYGSAIEFSSTAGATVTGNTIGGITIGGTLVGSGGNIFNGIYVIYGSDTEASTEISNNVIGSTTVADNIRSVSSTLPISIYGISINTGAPGTVSCKNNLIAGMTAGYTGRQAQTTVTGIVSSGASASTIDHNTISDLRSASLMQNANAYGIVHSSDASSVISNNIIRRLGLTGTDVIPVTNGNYSSVNGVAVIGEGTAAVYNNKIYALSSAHNPGADTSTFVSGIVAEANAIVYNNLVSLDNASLTNRCGMSGIIIASFTISVLHNTIYIGGNDGSAISSASAYSSAIKRVGSRGTYTIRNNILVNDRIGMDNRHYIYYSPSTSMRAMPANNMLVSGHIGNIAKWGGSNLDSTAWKTAGGDVNGSFYATSQIAPADLFTEMTIADLSVREAARSYVAGKGASGTGISTDYAGKSRSTTAPSAGAYEYAVPPPAPPLAGTYLVGNSQPVYKKLTDVAAALNDPANQVTGDVIFELDSDYEGYMGETLPIVFKQFNSSGNWTVTIRPKAGVGMRKTSGDPGSNTSLIILDGADRLILDGRAGGTGDINWLLRNTRILNDAGPTLYLKNDAQKNVFTWLQLEGQARSTNLSVNPTAIIFLGGTSKTAGNDSNTISYCTIRDRSDIRATPVAGIISKATSSSITSFNSGLTITHNNFINIYNSFGQTYYIHLSNGTTDARVTYNNFYQTFAYEDATSRSIFGIAIEEDAASNMEISYNYIGGSAPQCGGTPFVVKATTPGQYCTFYPVFAKASSNTSTGNTISHNMISNIDLDTYAPGFGLDAFSGITVLEWPAAITDNTIGDAARSGDIRLTIKGNPEARVHGMQVDGPVGRIIKGNRIGGITIGGTSSGGANYFYGIDFNASGPDMPINIDISDNIIGSATGDTSIRMQSDGMQLNFKGIYAFARGTVSASVKNNTIAGVSLSYTGPEQNSYSSAAMELGGTFAAEHNLISDIAVNSVTNLIGIQYESGGLYPNSLHDNTIRRLRLAAAPEPLEQNSSIFGIRISGETSIDVYNNRLYDLSSSQIHTSSGMGSWISGMELTGPVSAYNNLLSLTNGDNNNACMIKGIDVINSPSIINVSHNTIYIGGSNNQAQVFSTAISSGNNSQPYYVRNNILVNARTGGRGNYISFTSERTPQVVSDNNIVVVTDLNRIAEWNYTEIDSAQWKTAGRDVNSSFYTVSQLQPSAFFIDPSLCDLGIQTSMRRYVASKGMAGTGVTADFIGQQRSTTAPTPGAYEYIITNTAAPVVTSHNGAPSVTLQVPENTTAVTTITATDADADVLTYSLVNEEDAGKFSIDPSTGALSFIAAPDFEIPGDGNGDNTYILTVQVSDGEFTASQRFKLKITDANDHAPVITSYNGDITVSLRAEENTPAVLATVKATDVDKNAVITYSIVAEEDGSKLSVDPATGALKFITAPDFDHPGDTNGDNVYIVTVKASDGDSSATQRFKIKVTDLNDNAPVFTSHSGNATVNLELTENTQAVTTVAAIDGDGTVITYSILNEDDGALFSLNASGQLSFVTPPDFEHPADANHDNIYTVSVKASDGSLSAVQQFNIRITDLNDNLPMVTMTVRMPENTVVVTDLEASDADAGSSFTLDILNEEDGAQFRINPASGTLEFATAPDFEHPADADADNTYLVLIKISDNGFSFILRLKVKVTDIDESTGRSSNTTAKGPEVPQSQKAVAPQTATETGKGIRAYPNPVTGKRFTLRIEGAEAGRYLLEIYTVTGQLVYRQQLDHTGKTVLYPVQLPANLSHGMYVLKLAGVKTRFTERLLIE